MKHVFLMVCMLGSALFTYGQIEKPILKGNWTLGGSIGYSNTSETADMDEHMHLNDFDFSPSMGYFFVNRLTIGISPVISHSKRESRDYQIDDDTHFRIDRTTNTTALGLAPYVRYYFTNGFFVTAHIKYAKNRVNSDSKIIGFDNSDSPYDDFYSETNTKYNYGTLGYGLGAGYAYFINSKVSVDCSLIYQKEKQVTKEEKSDRDSSTSQYSKSYLSSDITKSSFFIKVGLNVFL